MSLLIHVGVRLDEAPTFKAQLERATGNQIAIETGYDGWNQWGSPYQFEENSDNTIHIQLRTVTPLTLLNLLVTRFANFLVPRAHDSAQIIVTDKDDISIEYLEFRYPDVVGAEVISVGI